MNTFGYFLIEIGITLIICLSTIAYLRPVLLKILIDLCGTDERGRFWTTFMGVILLALPLISSLGFVPSTNPGDDLVYEIAHQLKNNLFNFILSLALIGFILLFFSASVSRTRGEHNQEPDIRK